MVTAGVTHDVVIEDVDGSNQRGFMLARQNGRRSYSMVDAQTIGPRVATEGEFTQAQFPPEVAQYWYQQDWRAGIGGIYHRQHPNQLADATMIDTTAEGIIRPARTTIVPTVDTNPDNYVPSGFAVVGTEVWAFIGRDVYSHNFALNTWLIGTEPAASDHIYRNGVVFSGQTVVPRWARTTDVPQQYIFKADADANWIVSAEVIGAVAVTPKYLAVANGLLWGGYFNNTDRVHQISSTTDATAAGSWTGLVAVGGADAEITALVGLGETLLICKANGVWSYFSAGSDPTVYIENLTPEYEGRQHPDHFRGAFNWNGHVLLPLGGGGLMDMVEGRLYDVSMSIVAPRLTYLNGTVVAISGEPTRLYILVRETGQTRYHVLMAEWAEFQDRGDFRWHHVGRQAYVTGTTEYHSSLFCEGVPSGATIHHRTWFGVESTGSDLLPRMIPDVGDNNDGYSIDTASLAQTTVFDGNTPNVNKTFASVTFEIANLGAGGRQWVVTYRLNEAGSWLTLGTLNSTGTTQTLTFPSGTTGRTLELRYAPAMTAVGTTAPEIRSVRGVYTIRPDRRRIHEFVFYLADQQRLLSGARGGLPSGDLAQLRTWQGQAAEVNVINPEGDSIPMVFMPGAMGLQEVALERGRRPEYQVTIRLMEV